MAKITVLSGITSEKLARRVAKKLKASYVNSSLRIFPDGESKITLNTVPKKGKIIVIHSLNPPVDSNLIQTLSLLFKAKQYSSNVVAVIPYLGYARQDREFLPGEIITIKVIAKLFQSIGVSKIVVVDIHSKVALNQFKISSKNISAVPELTKYFSKLKLTKPIVVSPDQGGTERAKIFAKLLKTEHISLKKHRNRKTGKITITSLKFNQVKGRDMILVDDMVSTGGSIIKATEFLKKQKCKKVFVACTHGLLIGDALKKIRKAGVTQIVSTNTIPGKTAVVDISEIISKATK